MSDDRQAGLVASGVRVAGFESELAEVCVGPIGEGQGAVGAPGELSLANPTYGVRMLWAKLRQAGLVVNRKRVRRLCRLHGLLVRARRRRKRRGIGAGMPCRAEYPDQVWSYDFVEDRTHGGRNGGRK